MHPHPWREPILSSNVSITWGASSHILEPAGRRLTAARRVSDPGAPKVALQSQAQAGRRDSRGGERFMEAAALTIVLQPIGPPSIPSACGTHRGPSGTPVSPPDLWEDRDGRVWTVAVGDRRPARVGSQDALARRAGVLGADEVEERRSGRREGGVDSDGVGAVIRLDARGRSDEVGRVGGAERVVDYRE